VRKLYAAVVGFVMRYVHVYLGLSFLDLVEQKAWRKALSVEPELIHIAEKSNRELYTSLVAAEFRAIGTTTCAECGADCMIETTSNWSGFRCLVCGFNHEVEICCACGYDFFWNRLHECEGGRMICEECNKNY
jgi:hypothetical protein